MRAPISIKATKRTYHATVPTCWGDVTLEEFYNFTKWGLQEKNGRDLVQFYQIMTGIPYDVLKQLRDGSVTVTIDAFLAFLWENPEDAKLHERPRPKTITMEIDGEEKILQVPEKIEMKQLGQKWMVTDHFHSLKKEMKNQVDFQKHRAAGIIAIIMFQEITGSDDFDIDLAMAYKPRIMKLPAEIAIPLSIFFWNHFIELASNGPGNSKATRLFNKFKRKLIN